jgi:hypothetical protein
VRIGIDAHVAELGSGLAGQRVELDDASISSPKKLMRQAVSS